MNSKLLQAAIEDVARDPTRSNVHMLMDLLQQTLPEEAMTELGEMMIKLAVGNRMVRQWTAKWRERFRATGNHLLPPQGELLDRERDYLRRSVAVRLAEHMEDDQWYAVRLQSHNVEADHQTVRLDITGEACRLEVTPK